MQCRLLHHSRVPVLRTHLRQCVTHPRVSRPRIRCTDEDKEKEKETKKTPEATIAEQLKKQGMEKEGAQRILKVWKESGAESPEQLRRLFLRGSLRPIAAVIIQLLLDAGATYGCFVFAASIGALPGLPVPGLISLVGTFAGFYFLASATFDIVTLGQILWSIYRFGTNTDAFLEALQSIAGGSELNVIDKARKVVDTFKVLQALNEISDILREKGPGEITSLESLSAFLTLSHAEENYGFQPGKYGLTEKEATDIAVVFSRYDQNEDGVLQVSEIGNIAYELGETLDEEELNAAMQMLDTDKSGVIEFDEFVDWWVNKVKPERTEAVKS